MSDSEIQPPAIRDSDLIYLSIKRLELIAQKMAKYEYDDALDRMMGEAIEMFQWAAANIARRAAAVADES